MQIKVLAKTDYINMWHLPPLEHLVIFLTGSLQLIAKVEKMPTSQLELLLQRILHLREPLVGSLHWTVFHFTTEQGELKETTLYIILEMSTEQQTMAV